MKKRVLFSEDETQFGFVFNNVRGRMPTVEDINAYIDYFLDTDVTDFSMTLNGTISASPSNILETYADKYEQKELFGKAVNFEDSFARTYYHVQRVLGVNHFQIWIDRLRAGGVNPWICMRMNDCHHGDILTSSKINPTWSNASYRSTSSYFDIALNYLLDEVRENWLQYIEEQLSLYDVYGLELDFNREPYCFPAGKKEEGRRVMLDFVRRVREITDRIGRERGKEIKLAILCPADPICAYNDGFDIAEMAHLSLVDRVIACPRWDTINNDIPVAIWKKLLPHTVEFTCKQEILLRSYPYFRAHKFLTVSTDHSFGQAAVFERLGCDSVYLYNYMPFSYPEKNDPDAGLQIHSCSSMNPRNHKKLLSEIGTRGGFEKKNCRYPLTYDDALPLFTPPHPRLPAALLPGIVSFFKIVTGEIRREQKKYIIIETAEQIEPCTLDIWANGEIAKPSPTGKELSEMFPKNVYTYSFDAEIDGEVELEIIPSSPVEIHYIEILAEAVE